MSRRAALASFVSRPDATILPNDPGSIRQFQRHHGLVPDGIIGPKTQQAMRQTRTQLQPSLADRLLPNDRLHPH